jgi:diadenosine tetraphosphate (Ap4A) HIT family hydrolase
MSSWRDPDLWAAMCRGDACPICRDGTPRDIVAELETSWVAMGEDAAMRGYAVLVLRRHAVDLHDLTDDEGAAYMRDIRRLSRALANVTGAVKMNYEVHGNTIPHLHTHFFPRYVGDAFEGRPIDPRSITSPVYAPGELAAMRARVRELLAR